MGDDLPKKVAAPLVGAIPPQAITLIKDFEGCELEAYDDGAGVWTIGYGHTQGVRAGMVITQQQAEDWLMEELTERWNTLKASVTGWDGLSDNQRSALLSFNYNLGWLPGTPGFNQMNYMAKTQNWLDAPRIMQLYSFARDSNGEIIEAVSAGLKRRRQAEVALWTDQ
jgi:GH24 family phage-related lysozyme (muramidase)